MIKFIKNLFKSVDEQIAELGFVKVEDDEYGVQYERKNDKFAYTQSVDIIHKRSGRHIIQSYDKTNTTADFSPVVGLTYHETKLFLKKMKQKGWRSK